MSAFTRAVVTALLLALVATSARSDGIGGAWMLGQGIFGGLGGNGVGQSAAPVLTNLRITNTGDFRVTNTGDNRAVFP